MSDPTPALAQPSRVPAPLRPIAGLWYAIGARERGMLMALVAMCLGLWISNPDFLGQSNVVNSVRVVSMLGIFAIGMAFVIITGGIDLSVGSVIGLTGVLIAKAVLPPAGGAAPPVGGTRDILVGLGLLAVLLAGWGLGGRNLLAGAIIILAYVVAALGLLGKSGYAAGASGNVIMTVLRGLVLLLGAAGVVLALVRQKQWAFGGAAGILIAYQYYAILAIALEGGQPLYASIAVALATAIGIGLAQGLLITRLALQPFIVTLGGMLTLRGISQTVVEGGTLSLGGAAAGQDLLKLANYGLVSLFAGQGWATTAGWPSWLNFILQGIDVIPAPAGLFLAVILIATYVLHFTVFGRYVYAIGGNRDAAEYSGISVKRVETMTYVISAGLAGVAGVCWAAFIGEMSERVGLTYELLAIAACVLGGCSLRGGEGTVMGVIIGSAVMRVIENGIIMFRFGKYVDADGILRTRVIKPHWTYVIFGGVILIAVIMDQVMHMVQAHRRTRKVAPGGFEVVHPPRPPTEEGGPEPVDLRAPPK